MSRRSTQIDTSLAWTASPAALAEHLDVSEGAECWRRFPHLDYVNRLLLRAYRGEIKRLMISMPPGHGKSELLSVALPLWVLNLDPKARIILASYGSDFAASWGHRTRALALLHADKLHVQVDPKNSPVHWWHTTGGGYLRTAGIDAGLAGQRADWLIVDDPFKTMDDALSEAKRATAWRFHTSAGKTRMRRHARYVIVNTRWHEADLSGQILAKQTELEAAGQLQEEHRWHVVNFPALAEENDPLGRAPGEALCPELYDRRYLEMMRAENGPYEFGALYQGHPSPLEGGLIKRQWFRFYTQGEDSWITCDGERLRPASMFRFATMDLALTEKQTSDYTVLQAWAHDERKGRLILLGQIRERMEGAGHLDLIRQAIQRWNLDTVYVESVAYQAVLIQQGARAGLPVREFRADRSKVARVLAAQATLEQGRVWLPASAPWVEDLLHECASFPAGAHDDQVDCLSAACQVMTENDGGERVMESLAIALGTAEEEW